MSWISDGDVALAVTGSYPQTPWLRWYANDAGLFRTSRVEVDCPGIYAERKIEHGGIYTLFFEAVSG